MTVSLGAADVTYGCMSHAAFYREKAAECARQAQQSPDPERRAEYEEMQRAWLRIAEQAESPVEERWSFYEDLKNRRFKTAAT
jgi:hypothetical protein